MTNHSHDIDEQIRSAFHARIESADSDVHERQAVSHARVQARLDAFPRPSRPAPRWRRRRRAAFAAVIAVALLVVAASIPLRNVGDHASTPHTGIPGLPESASAAEALAFAGKVVVGNDSSPVGTGRYWYTSVESFADGARQTINEQWFDTRSSVFTLAAFGIDRHDDRPRGAREILLLDAVGKDGVQRIRTFERPLDADVWRRVPGVGPGGAGPHETFDVPPGHGPRQRVLGASISTWIRETSTTSDRDEISQGTRAFMGATLNDYFTAGPDITQESIDAMRANGSVEVDPAWYEDARTSARTRQVLFLLATTRPSPEATRYLYDWVADFEQLERLPNVEVDGHVALRIRYDTSDPKLSPQRERVLVIDAETGQALRTETMDRSAWTTIRSARRVDAIGDESRICAVARQLPCTTIQLRGALADEADAAAAAWGRSIAATRSFSAAHGARPVGQQNAFMTTIPLTDNENPGGFSGSPGGCARDWRYLSLCRG